MYEKGKDLASAFVTKRLGRRELVRRMGQLGLTVAGAKFLVNQASTAALAADFDWKKHQGTKLNLLMNKHPYMDALVADLDNFKTLTGMEVSYDVFPEDVYFDKVTAALSSGSSQYDAFMTGAYHDLAVRPRRLAGRHGRVHQRSGADRAQLRLGGHPAQPARLDRLVGRTGRRARR